MTEADGLKLKEIYNDHAVGEYHVKYLVRSNNMRKNKDMARMTCEAGTRGADGYNMHHRKQRAKVRQYLSRCLDDPGYWYEYQDPQDHFDYWAYDTEPDYNTSFLYSYLDSKCGEKWNDVWSELCHKYDRRIYRNYRMLYLIDYNVQTAPDYRRSELDPWWFGTYHVREDGILRKNPRYQRGRHVYQPRENGKVNYDTKFLVEWFNNRLVAQLGASYFWYVPTQWHWTREAYQMEWLDWWVEYTEWSREMKGSKPSRTRYRRVWVVKHRRQDKKLTKDEVKIWNSLRVKVQENYTFRTTKQIEELWKQRRDQWRQYDL